MEILGSVNLGDSFCNQATFRQLLSSADEMPYGFTFSDFLLLTLDVLPLPRYSFGQWSANRSPDFTAPSMYPWKFRSVCSPQKCTFPWRTFSMPANSVSF